MSTRVHIGRGLA